MCSVVSPLKGNSTHRQAVDMGSKGCTISADTVPTSLPATSKRVF